MDLAPTFHDVVKIANSAEDAATGWRLLVGYLEDRGGEVLGELTRVDMQHDVDDVRRQVQGLLASEPPPSDLNAVYFGLFDALDSGDTETIGYYIAGVKAFDPDDGDSLCDPAWWPEERYLTSHALDAIKKVEVSARARGVRDLRALLGYAGQLGAALLVSRFAVAGLFPSHRCVVGFDSGDFAEVVA